MDPNQAVIDVGAQLNEARNNGESAARLVVRSRDILLIGLAAIQDSDIIITHLSSREVTYGPTSTKWNHIEDRIRDLILEGVL